MQHNTLAKPACHTRPWQNLHVVVLQRNAHQHHQEVQPPHHLAEPACDTRPWQNLHATEDPGRTCMRQKTLAEPACNTRPWQSVHATQHPALSPATSGGSHHDCHRDETFLLLFTLCINGFLLQRETYVCHRQSFGTQKHARQTDRDNHKVTVST